MGEGVFTGFISFCSVLKRERSLIALSFLFCSPILKADSCVLLLQPPLPSVGRSDVRDAGIRAEQTVALFLREWLEQEPAVRLVDESQSVALFRTLQSPAWRRKPEDNLLPLIRPCAAVDALATWRWREGVLSLTLHRQKGVSRFEFRWPSAASAPSALAGITSVLARALSVPFTNCPLGRTIPEDDGALLETVYMARRFRADWVNNSGEARLELLQPYNKRLTPWIAAAILNAAATLSSDKRNPQHPESGILMAQMALPAVLGTPFENEAHQFFRLNRFQTQILERAMLDMIRPSARDPLDTTSASSANLLADVQDEVVNALGGPRTPEQTAGAIRCLGTLRSRAALPLFEALFRSERPLWRQAVANALREFEPPAGRMELERLATDADISVSTEALYSLWKRGELKQPTVLVTRAMQRLSQTTCDSAAVEILAVEGGAEVANRLKQVLRSNRVECRQWAVRGLIRLQAMDREVIDALLCDPDARALQTVLDHLPAAVLPDVFDRLKVLANHTHGSLAEAARRRLASLAPDEPMARRRFELDVEHPYVRRRIVLELSEDSTESALKLLREACRNSDPHTRAAALQGLARREADGAAEIALDRLTDEHRWVVLYAAAVLADIARPCDAGRLRVAIRAETEPAVRRHLEIALARAEFRSPEPTLIPVHGIPTNRTVVFLCGHGEEAPRSPIHGYYQLAYKPDEAARAAHAAGKIILARANQTARHPGFVFFHDRWGDGFWLGLEEEFGDLTALDGIVVGEESMSFRPFQLWEMGWRLFCREEGIDPDRIHGDREQLTEMEKAAWWRWEQRVSIEGFNLIYEYIKTRFGVLRPGFQVCTFMPDQNGPCEFDQDWRFDIGAGYYYETNNRHRYTQIRRFKTVWPDRPVIWLVDATARSLHQPLNYQFTPGSNTVPDPGSPLLADALCAWMAGAHPGYFYARLALSKDMKPGPNASGKWVFLEDLSPRSPLLQEIVDHIFRGVEDHYRTLEGLKALKGAPDAALSHMASGTKDGVLDHLIDEKVEEDPIRKRVEKEKEAMRWGLLLERSFAWEWARLLADLPPPPSPDPVLLVGDLRAETGGLRLPNSYDALHQVNAIAGRPLGRYRFIAIANGEKEPVALSVRTNLLQWLQATPGILYVHGRLDSEDHQEKWPWASDLRFRENSYEIISTVAEPLEGESARASLVFWQGAGYRGGVVFDGGAISFASLRDHLNRLVSSRAIGWRFSGPIGVEAVSWNGVKAMVSCRRAAVEEAVLEGLDPMTGRRNPMLPRNRTGALTIESFRGQHLVVTNGWSLISEFPLEEGQWRVNVGEAVGRANGLLRVVTESRITPYGPDGEPLPLVPENRLFSWLLEREEPGFAVRETDAGVVTWIRAQGMVRMVFNGSQTEKL